MTKFTNQNLKFILEFLTKNKQTISVAESCTGGYLAYLLTILPGSSNIFIQGFVTYATESKVNCLHIQKEEIEKTGVVSAEVAVEMANKIMDISKSTYGIGITGNAGPTICKDSKSVGEVYVCISSHKKTICYALQINGIRDQIRKNTATETIRLFVDFLKENE